MLYFGYIQILVDLCPCLYKLVQAGEPFQMAQWSCSCCTRRTLDQPTFLLVIVVLLFQP